MTKVLLFQIKGMVAGSIAKDNPEGVLAAFSSWLPELMSHAVVPNTCHVLLYNVMVSDLGLISSLHIHYLICDITV